MRSGQHYAEFTWDTTGSVLVGVIGAGFDVEDGENAFNHTGEHKGCFYFASNGSRFPDGGDWEGMQPAVKGDGSLTFLLRLLHRFQ